MIVAKPDQNTNITVAEDKLVMHTLAEGMQVSLRSCVLLHPSRPAMFLPPLFVSLVLTAWLPGNQAVVTLNLPKQF